MEKRKLFRVVALFIAIFILSNSTFAAQPSLQDMIKQARFFKKRGRVLLNFEKIDLKLLSYFMAELTGKNIVLDPKIRGSVSLIFSKPISIKSAWAVYTAILKSKNYSVIEKRGYVEVVPEGISRKTTPPIEPAGQSDNLITYVYELKNAQLNAALTVLRGLKSTRGNVLAYTPSQTLIITDFSSNVQVMKKVISLIDSVSSEETVKVFQLKNTSSQEVASALNVVFSDLSRKGIFFKVFSIKSQNSLLVKTQKKYIDQVANLIKLLDVETGAKTYRTFWTVDLQNSKAEDIANVLNKLLENIQLVQVEESKTPHASKSKKAKKPSIRTIASPRTSKTDKPKVIAEKSTNTLIIYANNAEYKAIKNLMDNLDRRRKQVLVSALITEVSEDKLREIGVRWQALGTQGGAAFRGGLSKEDFYASTKSSGFIAGVLSTAGRTIEIGGQNLFFPDLLFLMSLIERGSGFNIISSPKILTMDNQEATINVAQVVPFAESTKFDVNGNPIITYDYKEVGLKLKVTPHISKKDVVLELHQEINEVVKLEKLQLGQLSYTVPTTSKRELDTVITVQNGKTVVLGGLISQKTVKSMEGIPLISKAPIIGNLFKYRSNQFTKTNLFVFITPFIINSPEDLSKITELHKRLSQNLDKKVKKVEKKKKANIMEQYNKFIGR